MVTNEKELYSELLNYVEGKEINNRQDLVKVISEFTGLDEFDEGFDDLAYLVQKKLGVIFFDTAEPTIDSDDDFDSNEEEIYIDDKGDEWGTYEDGSHYRKTGYIKSDFDETLLEDAKTIAKHLESEGNVKGISISTDEYSDAYLACEDELIGDYSDWNDDYYNLMDAFEYVWGAKYLPE